MRATNQGGSLAGFIIIGVLLTLVLVGGLYGLNRYNAQKAADEVAAREETAAEKSEATTDKRQATPGDTDSTSRERTGTSSGNSTLEKKPAATTPANGGATSSAQLPQTGPADTFGSLIAIGALTFVGTYYARSRSRH